MREFIAIVIASFVGAYLTLYLVPDMQIVGVFLLVLFGFLAGIPAGFLLGAASKKPSSVAQRVDELRAELESDDMFVYERKTPVSVMRREAGSDVWVKVTPS